MKIRRYEVVKAVGCYVIRKEGILAAIGRIAFTSGLSNADRRAARLLVEQANAMPELVEALRISKGNAITHNQRKQ